MPAKEIVDALQDLRAAGWRVQLAGGRAHAYARAYCPGGESGCPPLTVYGRQTVNTYWFDVEVAGPVTEEHTEALGEVLAAAAGVDATVQAGQLGGRVMFSREADDAVQAVVSALQHTEAAGMTVTGVREDLVSTAEIAERARVTAASVRYWISGERGPGGFPEPRVRRQRASLYSWAEVSAWLAAARLGEVDQLAAETARACALVSAALIVRAGLRDLPAHDRPLLARLVA